MIHYSVTTESWVFADVTRGHTFSSFFLFYVFKASLFFKKCTPTDRYPLVTIKRRKLSQQTMVKNKKQIQQRGECKVPLETLRVGKHPTPLRKG